MSDAACVRGFGRHRHAQPSCVWPLGFTRRATTSTTRASGTRAGARACRRPLPGCKISGSTLTLTAVRRFAVLSLAEIWAASWLAPVIGLNMIKERSHGVSLKESALPGSNLSSAEPLLMRVSVGVQLCVRT